MKAQGKGKEEIKEVSQVENIKGLTEPILNLNGLSYADKYQVSGKVLKIAEAIPDLLENILNNAPTGLEKFSDRNKALILLQKPNATEVKSFSDWKNQSCRPDGTGKALYYLAPATKKGSKDNEVIKDDEGKPKFIWVWGFDQEDVIFSDELEEENAKIKTIEEKTPWKYNK